MDFTQRKWEKVAGEQGLMLSLWMEEEEFYLELGNELLKYIFWHYFFKKSSVECLCKAIMVHKHEEQKFLKRQIRL